MALNDCSASEGGGVDLYLVDTQVVYLLVVMRKTDREY